MGNYKQFGRGFLKVMVVMGDLNANMGSDNILLKYGWRGMVLVL